MIVEAGDKIHPTTWGEVTAEADGIYKGGMAAFVIEMRLCKDNRKATCLRTQNYPSWYNNQVKKNTIGDVKKEPKAEGVDQPAPNKMMRTADDVATLSSSKRFKKGALVPLTNCVSQSHWTNFADVTNITNVTKRTSIYIYERASSPPRPHPDASSNASETHPKLAPPAAKPLDT